MRPDKGAVIIFFGVFYMKNFCLALLMFAIFTLAACGPSNTVRLLPPPPLPASTIPAPNAPGVCVVNFKDDRLDPMSIGIRRDGSAFTTTGDVPLWLSRALADELARKGFRVTFAMNASQARSSNPDYIVTGAVNEVWLKENSATEMSVQMRISCTLASRKGKIWTESSNSSQSRSSLPSGASADNLLLDTLRDLTQPVAQKILQTAETRK